nr:immunoglobulin light chain junction region [Macaca mulatta]MOV75524.1 immunoglobulin light chain junction region [Macaca mulatta]MOV76871.1 immunoglobulin light chain junction region [Macaca mulatta]MOV78226.1 immunoglobulin light chain junction region [Macaca mulatta]MOV80840.1 immunoglobulin light chain junction region [Macaca mulatta]
CMQGTQLPYSF